MKYLQTKLFSLNNIKDLDFLDYLVSCFFNIVKGDFLVMLLFVVVVLPLR